MRIEFDYGDLTGFLAVMEAGSFSRAAERLNLSQSALSRRLQKLEAALGVSLFERTTRTVTPTVAARAFQARAAAMLADAEEAVAAVGDVQAAATRRRAETVTVAAVPTAMRRMLPAAIARFRAAGFTGRLRLSDLSADAVLEAVETGAADFGVTFMGGEEPGLAFHALADDPFVLAMPIGDALAEKASIRWTEIPPERAVTVWKGSGNRVAIDAAMARARIRLDWAYEVRHLSSALGLVEAGIGVAALPASAMPPEGQGLVTSRPLEAPDVVRVVGAVRRSGARLSAPAEAFYKAVLAISIRFSSGS